jgi:transcriptional regulator with XRE-family HTH domain
MTDKYLANDRLRETRSKKKLSRERLAQLLGTRIQTIAFWEQGKDFPDTEMQVKLCTALNASPEELGLLPRTLQQQALISPSRFSSSTHRNQPLFDPAIPLLSATPLIGRELILARIKALLCHKEEGMPAVALNGMPGVGKTAIATTLAYDKEIRNYFKAGVLWAGLGPQPNLQGILNHWAMFLGLSSYDLARWSNVEALANALHHRIGERTLLLIIDDVWNLEHALALKIGGSHCKYLITTRFPPIASQFASNGAITIQELEKEESIQLLHQLAPNVVKHATPKVYELIQAISGLPLALTLLGNYLRIQSYSGQTRRITAALTRLLTDTQQRLHISEPHSPSEYSTNLPANTLISLQSVIAVTDRYLDEESRATLYALSVLPAKPDSFSEEAALAVARCAVEILDNLVDASLIEVNKHGRYTMHQVIADYAQMSLQDEARERFITYYCHYAIEHQEQYELLEQESAAMDRSLADGIQIQAMATASREYLRFGQILACSRPLFIGRTTTPACPECGSHPRRYIRLSKDTALPRRNSRETGTA